MRSGTPPPDSPRLDRRAFAAGLAALGATALLAAEAAPRERTPSTGRIIISGAGGHLGELTIRDLLAHGIPASRLILVSREPDRLRAYAQQGATVRYGDFTQPRSLRDAFSGGRQMLLISIGFGPMPRPQAHKNAIDAAKASGVEHIAYTSWIALTRGDRSGLGVDHFQTEQALRQSGLAWTMLRNSIYMEETLSPAAKMVASGLAQVPRDDDHIAYVARADCAAAAAAVLATTGHDDKVYNITGPQLIDTRDIAQTATAVTGKPIRIENAPPAPPRGPRMFGRTSVAIMSDAVAELTGRPAVSLKTFFERHRAELLGERVPT